LQKKRLFDSALTDVWQATSTVTKTGQSVDKTDHYMWWTDWGCDHETCIAPLSRTTDELKEVTAYKNVKHFSDILIPCVIAVIAMNAATDNDNLASTSTQTFYHCVPQRCWTM